VVQIKRIKKGTPVGYGITERVRKDSTIAVLPVGYYDGFFRGLSSIGRVLINGQSCKILGRISMNLCVTDVSSVSAVKVWDEAVLIGQSGEEKITPEEIAQKLGTISYEVVARINPLLPRIYI
jgi:alanine racemase